MDHLTARSFAIIALILFHCAATASHAAPKESPKDAAHRRCENRYASCEAKCDGSRLWREEKDCRDGCTTNYARCARRANTLGAIKSEPGDGGSAAPVLSTD